MERGEVGDKGSVRFESQNFKSRKLFKAFSVIATKLGLFFPQTISVMKMYFAVIINFDECP